ncbi:ATP-binding protein [Haliea alexandrii]|uniref:ATP-binding protein n=1 Tax=Haliea alexandrii TaxID=2448162 RepID=UPI000F0B3798|nr:ATP-binding protein [Haliea alexandrii]|tara:strand:+ start:11086 stop:12165 length:1080 start_codon:yes stop_codon:yes gene_type:complete
MRREIDFILTRTPGLKAKEIAKRLGVTRKEVNTFLHQNTDRYVKDDDYCWSSIGANEIEITLPGKWLTADDFESRLLRADDMDSSPGSLVRVVFTNRCKPMIDCTARLLSLANQCAHQGREVELDFSAADSTFTYLDRAGFFDNLAPDVVVLPERPSESAAVRHRGNSDTLVEFGCVDPDIENDELINQLTEKFVARTTSDYLTAAYTVFSELIKNVAEHSETPIPGFAGLQRYQGNREHIQTVISDSGIGIASTLRPSLREHYPHLFTQFGQSSLESDMGLVAEVMSKGEISRSGGANGLGFKSSREQAVKFNVLFSVRQENFCLKLLYENGALVDIKRETGLRKLLGTHICFDFFLA